MILLDTNCCIDLIRGTPEDARRRLTRLAVGTVAISSITFAELCHGVEKSAQPGRNRVALTQFCLPLEVLPFDAPAAAEYGAIRAVLERKGTVIGPLDLLIAAHARALDATLVTNNLREFRRVPGLRVEAWG